MVGKWVGQGFSLAEVLVALAVMSLALVGLVAVLTTGLKRESQSSRRVAAYDMAEHVLSRSLEELEYRGIEVEDFWEGDFSSESTPWRRGETTVGGIRYTYLILAKNVVNLTTGELFGRASGAKYNTLKQLEVEVAWEGGTNSLTLTRLVNRVHR